MRTNVSFLNKKSLCFHRYTIKRAEEQQDPQKDPGPEWTAIVHARILKIQPVCVLHMILLFFWDHVCPSPEVLYH